MDMFQVVQIIANISVIGTLILVIQQLSLSRNQAKGSFIFELDQQFQEHEETYLSILNNKNPLLTDEEKYKLWRLLGTFERCKILIDHGLLNIDVFDNFYGYKIYRLVETLHVKTTIINDYKEHKVFIALCEQIIEYKRQQDPGKTVDRKGELKDSSDITFENSINTIKASYQLLNKKP